MTKTLIFFIVFTSMRIKYYLRLVQSFPLLAVIILFLFAACNRSANELPVMPPSTNPLAREYIGFGVVTASFAHVLSEQGSAGVSQGSLRRGTVVRIQERTQIFNQGRSETWVLAESTQEESGTISRGWLPETSLDIFNSEGRANTASRNMIQ